jgi:SAM-dependent methyltransferase
VDISIVALQEARRRIGDHGLFVVADVANLPFRAEPFDGVVSLHTLHHLPLEDQRKAYDELYRVLKPGCSAVLVNGWTESPLMQRMGWLVSLMEGAGRLINRLRRRETAQPAQQPASSEKKEAQPVGTFIRKQNPAWLQEQIGGRMQYAIYCWRSVSVRFLRAVMHDITGGRVWLRLLFWLEDRFPRFFGENGQYPLIVIRK